MGLFITLEGPEGAGKTTQGRLLADYLRQKGERLLYTREPGGTSIGDKVRNLLLDASYAEIATETEILLYSASRAQLVQEKILPHLREGGTVLCDRYIDSFFAYQGYGRGVDLNLLRQITHFATRSLRPDVTIYLDLEVEEGLHRKSRAKVENNGEWNRLDQLEIAFHQRVRQGYLEMMALEPERWLRIDASPSVAEIQQKIRAGLEQRLNFKQRIEDQT